MKEGLVGVGMINVDEKTGYCTLEKGEDKFSLLNHFFEDLYICFVCCVFSKTTSMLLLISLLSGC